MTLRSLIARVGTWEQLNFVLTNRIPRRRLTRFVGWLSKVEQPFVRDVSIGVWRLFSDLDLRDAETTRFRSMHDCFTRRLKPGARPTDPDPGALVSPCDGIVGASGTIRGSTLVQAKGLSYSLPELLCDAELAARYRDGCFVTFRLTSAMYHRFHAPHDCRVEAVTYVSGDAWNVNPAALRRVDRLFCRNERAVIRTRLAAGGHPVTLVPVGAILVSSIRLNFLTVRLPEQAGTTIPCTAAFAKGDEMGWFEHGSTIIVLAPNGFGLAQHVREGAVVRMGRPLMWVPRAETLPAGG